MTTRIINIAFVLLTMLSTSVYAQAPESKTFTKSFNSDNKGMLRLELPGTVDLKVWDNPSIRFEIAVALPAGKGAMLNELANIGRYNLTAKAEGDALVIQAPNLQKQLKVKGEALKETLNFVVYAPKDMQIQVMPSTNTVAEVKK